MVAEFGLDIGIVGIDPDPRRMDRAPLGIAPLEAARRQNERWE
ncbi:hypothetical protein [Jannaschia seohaensis]|uniref:Uncharacterized protein n=1 Tax=Jannaschia seohaensis TaxID=475081 RepID=A0A2Y9APN2_9RHOB|nr:hypothetical protein [Jannaschia seohaensis]PWJ19394.1 hypothetical protein BCF38_104331 [Jannaschia seohaensis]SSA46056.1 hypothetical protein SAMN05421539_104331 [Jannaschia seohaensis]